MDFQTIHRCMFDLWGVYPAKGIVDAGATALSVSVEAGSAMMAHLMKRAARTSFSKPMGSEITQVDTHPPANRNIAIFNSVCRAMGMRAGSGLDGIELVGVLSEGSDLETQKPF